MNRFPVALVLALAVTSSVLGSALHSQITQQQQPSSGTAPATQQTPQQQQTPPSPSGATAPGAAAGEQPTNQKVIKDPNEYNAYIAALNTQDFTQKAAAMEAFAAKYPQSVVLMDSLEQAMAAYQQAGNQAKVEEIAKRILSIDPNNVRALAIVTAIDRGLATNGNAAALQEACSDAQKGTQALGSWPKPQAVSEADYEKLRNQMADIFTGTSGFCALQAKDYATARSFYQKAVQLDPANWQDMYQLAIASLEMKPLDVTGFWYGAKAINLAQAQHNTAAVQSMTPYFTAKYKNFHGGTDGWEQIVASASADPAPPQGFTVKAAPTPQELACKAVQENDPAQLSFADWEFILQYRDAAPCNKQAADKVWAAIQEKEKNGEAKLKIPVKVISASRDSIDAAVSDDNQKANKADMRIEMAKPLVKPPAAGSTTDIIGVIADYQPSPFMFIMKQGELPTAKPAVPRRVRRKGK
jgi:tetratricopeptide (TPR) repeat protein